MTDWVTSFMQDSLRGVTRGKLGEEIHRLNSVFYRTGNLLDVQCGVRSQPDGFAWPMDVQKARRREERSTKALWQFLVRVARSVEFRPP